MTANSTKPKALDYHFTDSSAMYHGDCVELVRGLPDNSVDMVLTSIPFSDQYTYSPSDHDMGNNVGDEGFFAHLEWLIPELKRVTVPGRIAAIHCKDRLRYKGKWGTGGLNPFSDDVTTLMRKHGWQLHARITIATDPVRELQQTKRQGLRYMDIKQDASMCGPGIPEYLMVYRKWDGLPDDRAFSAKRVTHDPDEYTLQRWQLEANAIWQSDGLVLPVPLYDHERRVAELESGYDLAALPDGSDWRRVAYAGGRYKGPEILHAPPWVWLDVDRMKTLNYQVAKEAQDEKHICPLQLDLVERAIRLWTNPGDVVLDPFAGIGSVPFKAVEMGRRGVGFELKQSYFNWACRYLSDAERLQKTETLFGRAGVATPAR